MNYPDQLASLAGAALVVQCLADGAGAIHIDLSQRELVELDAGRPAGGPVDHRADRRAGTGNRRPHAVPHDAYRCQGPDRWVAVACFDDTQRAALAQLLGAVPDWADLDAVDAALGAWTAARTREECVAALRSAGVRLRSRCWATHRTVRRIPNSSRRRVSIDGPTGRRTRGFPFVLRTTSRRSPPARRAASTTSASRRNRTRADRQQADRAV